MSEISVPEGRPPGTGTRLKNPLTGEGNQQLERVGNDYTEKRFYCGRDIFSSERLQFLRHSY